MASSINLIGFDRFGDKLKGLPKQVEKEIGAEIRFAAREWEGRATRSAPADQGRLRGEIKSFSISPLSAEIVANVDYAAFIEWGTKTKVRVPPDMATYAATFRGGRKGAGNAKRFIYAWMRRVGVPEELQWITFISIIVNGIKPQPFFFIHKRPIERELVRNIQNILNSPH